MIERKPSKKEPRYCDWRRLETFRDRTPEQLEVLRHMSPERQFGRRRRVGNWITAL